MGFFAATAKQNLIFFLPLCLSRRARDCSSRINETKLVQVSNSPLPPLFPSPFLSQLLSLSFLSLPLHPPLKILPPACHKGRKETTSGWNKPILLTLSPRKPCLKWKKGKKWDPTPSHNLTPPLHSVKHPPLPSSPRDGYLEEGHGRYAELRGGHL